MKRKYVPKYPKIKTIKPIFWRRCILCDYEYKRELMYNIKDLCYCMGGVLVDNVFICSNCAHSEKDALEKYQ